MWISPQAAAAAVDSPDPGEKTKKNPSQGITLLLSVPDYMWILKTYLEKERSIKKNCYDVYLLKNRVAPFLHLSFGLYKLNLKLKLILFDRVLSAAGRSGLCCSTGQPIVTHCIQEKENCQEGHNSRQYVELLPSVSHGILYCVVVV